MAANLIIFLVFAVFAVAFFAVFVWALVDALRRSDGEWESAGESKWLWVLLIVLLGILGAALYAFIPRPKLQRVRTGGAS